MTGPSGPRRVGGPSTSGWPPRKPIAELERRVGRFSHLLPQALISEAAFWGRTAALVGRKELNVSESRQLIPAVLLPAFKLMLQTPFDLLVSIPRAGDPVAYALLRLAEAARASGLPVPRSPRHESFGSSSSLPPIVNFNFFTDNEPTQAVPDQIKAKVVQAVQRLSAEQRADLFRQRTFDSLVEALSAGLSWVLNWFMKDTSARFKTAAVPVLSEILKETERARDLSAVRRILVVDDCVQDGAAFDSVRYPLKVFAPQAEVKLALFGGTQDDADCYDALCCRGNWTMFQPGQDEWTGPVGGPAATEIGSAAYKLAPAHLFAGFPGVEEHRKLALFSFLLNEGLSERGWLFSHGASWRRKADLSRFETEYGGQKVSQLRAEIERILTDDFVSKLKAHSPLLARLTAGRLEIDKGIEKLFAGGQERQRLLKAYLESPLDSERLRPVSNLLILLSQEG